MVVSVENLKKKSTDRRIQSNNNIYLVTSLAENKF